MNSKPNWKKGFRKLPDKITHLDNGGRLEGKLIAVTTDSSGPFTLIEGNKRAVAFLNRKELIGTELYLGLSDKIRHYHWAKYASY